MDLIAENIVYTPFDAQITKVLQTPGAPKIGMAVQESSTRTIKSQVDYLSGRKGDGVQIMVTKMLSVKRRRRLARRYGDSFCSDGAEPSPSTIQSTPATSSPPPAKRRAPSSATRTSRASSSTSLLPFLLSRIATPPLPSPSSVASPSVVVEDTDLHSQAANHPPTNSSTAVSQPTSWPTVSTAPHVRRPHPHSVLSSHSPQRSFASPTTAISPRSTAVPPSHTSLRHTSSSASTSSLLSASAPTPTNHSSLLLSPRPSPSSSHGGSLAPPPHLGGGDLKGPTPCGKDVSPSGRALPAAAKSLHAASTPNST